MIDTKSPSTALAPDDETGWDEIARHWSFAPGITFLNHGSFGAAPRSVLAAADRWRRRMEANPDRFMREILPGELRAAAGGTRQ